MNVMTDLSVMKQRYDKVAEAIEQVNESGYGYRRADHRRPHARGAGDRQAGRRLRRAAEGVRAVHPYDPRQCRSAGLAIVGTERQSEELVKSLLKEFEEDPKKISGIPICSANRCTSWSERG